MRASGRFKQTVERPHRAGKLWCGLFGMRTSVLGATASCRCWSFLSFYVLLIFEFIQDCFGIGLQLIGIRCFFHKLLKIVGGLLILHLVVIVHSSDVE